MVYQQKTFFADRKTIVQQLKIPNPKMHLTNLEHFFVEDQIQHHEQQQHQQQPPGLPEQFSIHNFFRSSFPQLPPPNGVCDIMSKHNNTLIELIKSLESDKQNTANMVRLGMHYLEIVKTPTRYQYLIAASLLQISSEREGEHLENGEYWLALATAHFKIWLFDGILANEERLNLASSACQHAAKFVSEENLITLWETMASIFLYSGKLNHADDVLESMVVKFPDHPNLSSIYMFIAQVKGGLQKYDDAADLLKYVLNNPCHPYSEAGEPLGRRITSHNKPQIQLTYFFARAFIKIH